MHTVYSDPCVLEFHLMSIMVPAPLLSSIPIAACAFVSFTRLEKAIVHDSCRRGPVTGPVSPLAFGILHRRIAHMRVDRASASLVLLPDLCLSA
jgi:hypothetical protein